GSGTNHNSVWENTVTKVWEDTITLDSYIKDFLPSNWTHGPGVDQITFRQLQQHTSGFCPNNGQYTDGYGDLKTMVQTGVTTTPGSVEAYCNNAYALLRIL